MKLLAFIVLMFVSTAAIPQVSLIDAVRKAQADMDKPICITNREYWKATATIFSLLMEIGQLNRRVADLERQLGERR